MLLQCARPRRPDGVSLIGAAAWVSIRATVLWCELRGAACGGRREDNEGEWAVRVRRDVVRRVAVGVATAGVMTAAMGVLTASAATAPTSATQAPAPTADGLIARLAALRQPQTPADLLPAGTTLPRPEGTIIPSLTRLVAALPTMKLYLVVATPTGGSQPLWSRRLGDQVTVVAVGQPAAGAGTPFPAVDLDDPFHLADVGNRPSPTQPLTGVYHVTIVPDGVSRVRWRFATASGGRVGVENVEVSNNVAFAPVQQHTALLEQATWYAPDGTVVPTSDRALLHAIAARQAVWKAQAIRYDERHAHRAAPGLLADFAVFSITSRSPVREPGGITISHPRLAALPLAILQLFSRPWGPAQPDLLQTREIATQSGDRMWVVPGAHGLCLGVVDRSRFSFPLGVTGGGATCSGDLTHAETDGVGLSSAYPGGATTTYGVLPKSKPTIIVKIRGHKRVIRPAYGVYILHRSGHRHGNPSSVVVSSGSPG
jgi:hypothetical protein